MKCKIKWKRKPVLLILIVIFTIVFAAGCEADEKIPESLHDSAVTITDMMGREITLEEPVTKVIAMTPSDCEILYAIGAGEALVGRGEYCDYPPEVLELPKVCTGENTNLEEIISLKPQVVLMGTMGQTKEQVAALERAGIKVVVSQATDIEGVYSSVDMIGKLMNREEEAQNVINSMKKTFDEVSQKKVQMKGKTVYFEVSPLEYGLWTAGSGTFMNEIAEIIGLENCFADVEGWGKYQKSRF